MGNYRDDLSAAVARADALAREVELFEREGRRDRDRIRGLEVLLGAARQDLAAARAAAKGCAPAPLRVPAPSTPLRARVASLYLALALVAVALFAASMHW